MLIGPCKLHCRLCLTRTGGHVASNVTRHSSWPGKIVTGEETKEKEKEKGSLFVPYSVENLQFSAELEKQVQLRSGRWVCVFDQLPGLPRFAQSVAGAGHRGLRPVAEAKGSASTFF